MLLRNTCESEEAVNAAHTGGKNNRNHDDEVPQVIDVTYNEAEEHGNQLLAVASLEVWDTGEHHSDLPTHKRNTYASNGGILGDYHPEIE